MPFQHKQTVLATVLVHISHENVRSKQQQHFASWDTLVFQSLTIHYMQNSSHSVATVSFSCYQLV